MNTVVIFALLVAFAITLVVFVHSLDVGERRRRLVDRLQLKPAVARGPNRKRAR